MNAVLTRRAVLVTGKGGVGKTTVAAALARIAARSGRRILVAEVAADASSPSSMAAAFGVSRGTEEPQKLAPGIRGVLLTPGAGHRRFLQDTMPMRLLADAAMRSGAIRRFLGAAPAFSEMGVLYRILDLLRQRRPDGSFEHETCVIDLPATGHALALTQLPEVLLKVIPGGPIATAVREGISLFHDPLRAAAIVVTLPETLPVSEALALSSGLTRGKVHVAGIIANLVPHDPFTLEERAELTRLEASAGPLLGGRAVRRMDRARHAVARLKESVALQVLTLPEQDVRGPALVLAMSELLYEALRRSALEGTR